MGHHRASHEAEAPLLAQASRQRTSRSESRSTVHTSDRKALALGAAVQGILGQLKPVCSGVKRDHTIMLPANRAHIQQTNL